MDEDKRADFGLKIYKMVSGRLVLLEYPGPDDEIGIDVAFKFSDKKKCVEHRVPC